jgi:hypothetical protein
VDYSQKKREALLKSPAAAAAKVGDKYITNLVCGACGRPDAFADAANPNGTKCNHLNKCGAFVPLRSICPELYQSFEREFPPTKEDPNRPANEYLRSRGLSESLKGLSYSYAPRTRKGCGGAIMFHVGEKDGKPVFNGRLIGAIPPGEGKTHNIGSTSGMIWQHPERNYDPNAWTYLTEGIIDSLSINELGRQAVALLSAGADPGKLAKTILDRFRFVCFAFDNDEAGRKALRKWKACFEAEVKASDRKNTIDAIMLPRGDWNDFLLSGPIDKVKKEFTDRLPEFHTHAWLALANNAQEWAEAHYQYYKDTTALFLFEFNRCYWSAKVEKGNNAKTDEVLPPKRISNFVFRPKYRLLTSHGSDDLQFEHRLKVLKRSNR